MDLESLEYALQLPEKHITLETVEDLKNRYTISVILFVDENQNSSYVRMTFSILTGIRKKNNY